MTTNCPLCGFDYEPGGESCQASGCPLATRSCRKLHCPRCGYEVPDERASILARWVRRAFGGNDAVEPRPADDVRRLVELPTGTRVTVERIEGAPGLVAQLTAQGLVAGTTVELRQRHPGFVVEIGETTLAMERQVAAGIWVKPGGILH
jgi:Fe2+ transport system protein FeoA